MTDRDRLVELLKGAEKEVNKALIRPLALDEWIGIYADHLIANGVIVPPCKVGDVVYILSEKCKFSGEKNEPWNSCKQYWDNVYKNGMWGCRGKDEKENIIECEKKEMIWYAKKTQYSLDLYCDSITLGKNLFLTREEAEKKLEELEIK